MTFADIEGRVGDIVICKDAPEDVQNLLITSKNLLLYSWFYYPFSSTAALQAAVALERALKIRLKAQPRDTLTYLLKKAIRARLLTDAGFPRWRAHQEAFQQIHNIPIPLRPQSLVCLLLRTFPCFRNTMAHGSPFLDDVGFLHLDIANEAITQLFAAQSSAVE